MNSSSAISNQHSALYNHIASHLGGIKAIKTSQREFEVACKKILSTFDDLVDQSDGSDRRALNGQKIASRAFNQAHIATGRYVSYHDNEPRGVMVLDHIDEGLVLKALVTTRPSEGVGKSLLQEAVNFTMANTETEVLWVIADNPDAEGFFRQLGFITSSKFDPDRTLDEDNYEPPLMQLSPRTSGKWIPSGGGWALRS